MDYKKTNLKNNLRVISVSMPSIQSATVTVWVRTGSRFEEKKVNGISHFLEHIVFKGSKKRPSAKAISEAVDELGGEFNAGTSKEWTNFYIKARTANLRTAFDILSDMVINPLLKEEEIEKEKSVILEEIAMYNDTPMLKIGDVFENLIYQGNPLGTDISGTPETIKNVKRDDFVRYRGLHYYPENILVTVAGGSKEKEILKLSDEFFGKLPKTGKKQEIPNDKIKQKNPQLILSKKKVEQTHIIMGFKGDAVGAKRRFAESILSAILGGGMSSRLFIEVREKRALAYAVKTSSEHYLDNGYLATYAGLDIKRATEAIKVMLDQYWGIADKRYPISVKELKKAKEYIKGNLALSLEDTKNVSAFFGIEELLLNKPVTPNEVIKAIDKVSVDEVIEVAKDFFKPQNLNLAVIGPYKDKNLFKKLLD
ncbi:MAG TPA: pitrilysin family protein [Patescibacteria group bacterium]|nr:pitrilysin family protein [Patescibacteria group bacterium]